MPDNTMIDTTVIPTTTTASTERSAVADPASPAPSPDARAVTATAAASADHDPAPASTDPAPGAAHGATESTPTAEQAHPARSRNGKRPGTGGRRRAGSSSTTTPTTPKIHRARPATGAARGTGSEADTTADTADPSGAMIGEQVQDRLWEALRAHPAATAAELATHARISRAKASTLLAAWAAEGSVTAARGTTPRAARRWTATETPATTRADTGSPAGSRRPEPTEHTDPEPAPAQPDVQSTDEPATSPPTADAPRRTPSRNRSGSVRLAAGALRGLVEEYLTDHPGEHGPVEIGRAIGRSSGAVANALERLVADGWAARTGDRPKRYRTADTGDNTTGLTSTGPAGAAGPSGAATADPAAGEPE